MISICRVLYIPMVMRIQVPDKGLIKILAKQRLDSCLQIVKEDYDMEYSLYLVKQIGIYAGGGTERLIESLRKLHRD